MVILDSILCAALALAATVPSVGASGRFLLRASAVRSSSEPVQPLSVPDEHTQIHMLISAFQDGERCATTIRRALSKAQHPQRVSFNILQAVGEGDVTCLDEFRSKHLPAVCDNEETQCANAILARIHAWTISLEEGKGPVHQRGLLSERAQLSGEGSMCLSTDSHMSFVKAWDKLMLEDWTLANNEFAVLSAYPLATWDASIAGKKSYINLCGYFLEDGIPRGATGATLFNEDENSPDKPTLTMNWAAGQSFSRCHAERNVPVDKELKWLFTGEEVDRAVRLWTHGYDLYNPTVNAVLHNYSNAQQSFWNHPGDPSIMSEEQKASKVRIRALLAGEHVDGDFGTFGLGDQRTLKDYVTWSHTNLGEWGDYLHQHRLSPGVPQDDNNGYPGSNPAFCKSLQRQPVRDTNALKKSATIMSDNAVNSHREM